MSLTCRATRISLVLICRNDRPWPASRPRSRISNLRAAIAEIDTYFDELAMLTTAHLRYGNDTGLNGPLAA